MDESEISARWALNVGARPGIRIFRNEAGAGWVGQKVQQKDGLVVLRNARYVRFGLCPGSSDFIGWDHGRFLAVEMKTLTGKARADQMNFIEQVNKNGGLARIVRDPNDVDWLGLAVS